MKKYNYEELYDVELIRKMYQEGVAIKDICEYFDLSCTKLYRIMDRVGIQKNRNIYIPNFNEDTYLEFTNKFSNNKYVPFVPQKIYIKHHFNKYNYDETFFDSIDTPDKAYILGLLYADGSMTQDLGRTTISLQEKDVDVLSKINTLIKSDKPLTYVQSKHLNWQSTYRLDINNRHMCDALYYHGVVPNKSLILKFPTNIPFELYKDFFRGYTDGDGTIRKKRPESVSIISTKEFIEDAKLFIENHLKINCFYGKVESNGITTTLSIGGFNQTKKYLDWIYNGANLYIQRKYNIYNDIYK